MELLCTCNNFILLIDLQISPITKWEFTVKGLFHSYARTSENEKNIKRNQIMFGLSESFIRFSTDFSASWKLDTLDLKQSLLKVIPISQI